MAGIKPQRRPLFSFFRLASVVAAAALAIVVSLDVLTASGGLPAFGAMTRGAAQDAAMVGDDSLGAAAAEEVEAENAEPATAPSTEDMADQYFDDADVVEEALSGDEGADECVDCPPPLDGGADLGTPPLDDRHDFSAEATATAKWNQQEVDTELEDQIVTTASEFQPRSIGFWTPFRLVEIVIAALLLGLVGLTLITRRRLL